MARLALRAGLDFDSDAAKSQLCGPVLPQPVAVEVVNLVLGKECGRGGGRRREEVMEREDDRVGNRMRHNFKTFKKVFICPCHSRGQ